MLNTFIYSTNIFDHLLGTDLGPWDVTVARDKFPDLMEHIFQWGKTNTKHANK